MFDFDAGKLLIIGVIALIVIGPKELPRVLRQVGQAVGKMRRMAAEFQGQFMDAMKEADIQSIREEIDKVSRESKLDVHFDPARDIQSELTRTFETASVSAPTPSLDALPAGPSPTDGFAVPQVDLDPSHGTAPLADLDPPAAAQAVAEPTPDTSAPAAEDDVAAAPLPALASVPPTRKRKIVLRRRSFSRRPHEVWNRTGMPTGRMTNATRQGADL